MDKEQYTALIARLTEDANRLEQRGGKAIYFVEAPADQTKTIGFWRYRSNIADDIRQLIDFAEGSL